MFESSYLRFNQCYNYFLNIYTVANRDLQELLSLVIIGGVVYYVATQTDVVSQLKSLLSGLRAPGSGTLGKGGIDSNGVMLQGKTTGKSVNMNVGADHENGQRYNVNHTFQNALIVAYLKTVSSQEAIGCKNAGPNHGSCTQSPECFWIDPDFQLDDGHIILAYENPHPDSNDLNCSSCKAIGQDLHNKWVGMQWLEYGVPGNRWIEVWCDPSGLLAGNKPANKWVNVCKENYTSQLPSNLKNREIPVSFDEGLEAEIRMRGGHNTDMKYGKVYELDL